MFLKILILSTLFSSAYAKFVKVKGDSMEPLLKDKELVEIIEAKNLSFKHDDLVLFKMSTHKNFVVKAIKGLPGDPVTFKGVNILINSKLVTNSKGASLVFTDKELSRIKSKLKNGKLKAKQYLVFSDNLTNKFDSRSFGPIFSFQIVGKVLKP